MLAIFERFFKIFYQFMSNMTKKENFAYLLLWRASLKYHFQHGLTLQDLINIYLNPVSLLNHGTHFFIKIYVFDAYFRLGSMRNRFAPQG